MKDENNILIYFLSCFINKRKYDIPSDINWENIYRLSSLHAVSAIIYSVIKQFPSEKRPDKEILGKFQADFDYALVRSTNQEFEMQQLTSQFAENSIQHVFFKGYCIKQYYPIPELRTMGDIDFLIRQEDRNKAARILKENCFIAESETGDVWNYRKNKIAIEMHTKIAYGNFWNKYDYEKYFSVSFSQASFPNGNYTGYFDVNYHLIFLFFHLAKHINSTGAGIRMIMDIAIYIKELGEKLNWDIIAKELKRIKLKSFAMHVLYLCKEWFHVEVNGIPAKMNSKVYGETVSFIIAGGIFGYASRDNGEIILRNSMYDKQVNNKHMHIFTTIVKYFFPSLKNMQYSMPVLKNYPFLLPLAWIRRWWKGFFKRRKQAINTIKSILTNMAQAKEESEFIKRMGL